MATVRKRLRTDGTTAYNVRWREGGNGTECSETMPDEHQANLLRDYLNANGQSFSLASEAFKQSRAHGPTLEEMISRHVKELTGITPRTRADYARDGRLHIIPHLGGIRAGQLTRAHVRDWVNKMTAEGRAPKSISNYHGLLSAVMNTAIDHGVRSDNPCKGVRLPQRDRRGERDRFLEVSEYNVLLAQIPERWKPLVELLARTGLRWGEATALQVNDVVLSKAPNVVVDKAWKRDQFNQFYIERPKTSRSNREVSIDRELADMLAQLSEGRAPEDYLFTDDHGGPVMHRAFFRDIWKPAVNRATERRPDNPVPLRHRPKIHDLRHSHGSWLAADGVDLTTIQRRMGHESITTTVNTYGHVSERSQRAAADAMGRVLGGKEKKKKGKKKR